MVSTLTPAAAATRPMVNFGNRANSPLIPYYSTEAKLCLETIYLEPKESNRSGNGFLVAGIISALGASACCVGPLVLFTLGVSSLTALEPYRPIFVGLTVLFLAGAFHRLYLAHQVCTPGSACADPRTLKRSRMIFWSLRYWCLA